MEGACLRCEHCSSRYGRAGSLPPSFARPSLIPAPSSPVEDTVPDTSDEPVAQYLEAHLAKWAVSKGVQPLFNNFLQAVVDDSPSELDCILQYQCPSGSINANVVHILHWPPKSEDAKAYSSILESNNQSIRFLKETFINLKDHLVFDLYCKRENLRRSEGERKTQVELYGGSKTLHCHYEFAADLINHLKPRVPKSQPLCIVLWGSYVHQWFSEFFSSGSCISISGSEYEIYRVNHPEFLRRWANFEAIDENCKILKRISKNGLIDISLSELESLQEHRRFMKDAAPSYNRESDSMVLERHAYEDSERLQGSEDLKNFDQRPRLRENLKSQKSMALRKHYERRAKIRTLKFDPDNSVDGVAKGAKRKSVEEYYGIVASSDERGDCTKRVQLDNQGNDRAESIEEPLKSVEMDTSTIIGPLHRYLDLALALDRDQICRYELIFLRTLLHAKSTFKPNSVHMAMVVLQRRPSGSFKVIHLSTSNDSGDQFHIWHLYRDKNKEHQTYWTDVLRAQRPEARKMFIANPDVFQASIHIDVNPKEKDPLQLTPPLAFPQSLMRRSTLMFRGSNSSTYDLEYEVLKFEEDKDSEFIIEDFIWRDLIVEMETFFNDTYALYPLIREEKSPCCRKIIRWRFDRGSENEIRALCRFGMEQQGQCWFANFRLRIANLDFALKHLQGNTKVHMIRLKRNYPTTLFTLEDCKWAEVSRYSLDPISENKQAVHHNANPCVDSNASLRS